MGEQDLKATEERIRRGRHLARTDLFFLATHIMGFDKLVRRVHQPVIDHLVSFKDVQGTDLVDLENGIFQYTPLNDDPAEVLPEGPKDRRRLLLDPRSWFKTTINCVCHTVQILLNFPDVTIALIHAKQEFVESEIISRIKDAFVSNEKMRLYFPEFCVPYNPRSGKPEKFGTQAYFYLPNKKVKAGTPSVLGTSIDSAAAGRHFHWMKFTDIVTEQTALSRDQLGKVTKQFVMYDNILISPRYFIDVEGTCYDYADTYNDHIIEKAYNQYKIFVRGCFIKETPDGGPETFSPEERDYPYLLNENGLPISRFPEQFSTEQLLLKKEEDEWIFACTPGWQPVLMSDWSEKPIKDVKVGDEVWGWKKGKANRHKAVRSKVIDKGSHTQKVYEITLSDGEKVYSTIDHKWWTREFGKTQAKFEYRPATVGDSLVSFLLPKRQLTEEQKEAALWLGGIFDGEGSATKSNLVIYQSETENPEVCQRIRDSLTILHYPFSERWNRKSKGVKVWELRGGRGWHLRFLEECNPARRKDIIWKVEYHGIGRLSVEEKEIISIEEYSKEEVFWLTTETENYISGRKQSSNCQQLNNPIAADAENREFPPKKMSWIGPNEIKHVNFSQFTMRVDLAEKITERSDFTAITVVGWDRFGRAYLVDAVQGKFLPDASVDLMFTMYHKWKCSEVGIEESSFFRGLYPSVKRVIDLNPSKWMNVKFIKRDNQVNKTERIRALQPWYRAGTLRFSTSLNDYVKEQLQKQFGQYPAPKNDDLLDSLADHFQGKTQFGASKPRPTTKQVMDQAFDEMIRSRSIDEFRNAMGFQSTEDQYWERLGVQ